MITEKVFWEIVKELDWKKSQDKLKTRVLMNKLMALLDKDREKILSFSKIFHEKYQKVYALIDKHDDYLKQTQGHGYGLGDSYFSDLAAEIVGRGEVLYALVLEDPFEAYKMARKGDFGESFYYVVPSERDLDLLDPDHFKNVASQCAEEMNAKAVLDLKIKMLEEELKSLKKAKSVAKDYEKGIKLLAEGKFEKFKEVSNKFTEDCEKLLRLGLIDCRPINLTKDLLLSL